MDFNGVGAIFFEKLENHQEFCQIGCEDVPSDDVYWIQEQ